MDGSSHSSITERYSASVPNSPAALGGSFTGASVGGEARWRNLTRCTVPMLFPKFAPGLKSRYAMLLESGEAECRTRQKNLCGFITAF
jgi:hypothetical protein